MTEKEFLFGASIDLHWFPYPEAQKMLDMAKSTRLVKVEAGQLKPTFDVGSVDIPVGFSPHKDMFKNMATGKDEGLFPRLLKEAEAHGMKRRDFISQCNRIQDHMDVDVEAASLLILKDKGVDVEPFLTEARTLVRTR